MSTPKQIRVFIIEDEVLHLKDICILAEEAGYLIAGHCDNADLAFDQVKEIRPDVVLVDIALPGVNNGITLARKIQQELHIPHIFTTSMREDEVIQQAVNTHPAGYLQKPVDYGELRATISLALKKINGHASPCIQSKELDQESLYTRVGNRLIRVPLKEIRFARAGTNKYISVFLDGRELSCRLSLKDLLQQNPKSFIQIHRSVIINLDFLSEIDEFNLTVQVEEEELPIGRKYRKELFNRLRTV